SQVEGAARLWMLLDVLTTLSSNNEDLIPLSSLGFYSNLNEAENQRMNTIYSYLAKNYQREISLQEISQLANMSPTSFCRFFKSRTNKTLFRFINEIRIGHACKLLIDNEMSVTEICYACGFNHFSNFHKQFVALKKLTPLKYKQQIH
ncbi:MAG: helix-turn-helix domain-containing protein, partial [Cyclobacteriaceae bacterium]